MLRCFLLFAAATLAAAGQTLQHAAPCVDFYEYSCREWMESNPAPPDQPSWDRLAEMRERNLETLRGILERSAVAGPGAGPLDRLLGDYYASCMDEPAINALGTKPLEPELRKIHEISSLNDLAPVAASLFRAGVSALFRFGSDADLKNPGMMIADLDQGGLGLPERELYLRKDARSAVLREKYEQHVRTFLALLGDAEEAAARRARALLEIETALAEMSLDGATRREPSNIYHQMTVAELVRLAPSFDWKTFFAAAGAPEFETLNVAVPPFFAALEEQLTSRKLDDWKAYLTWHLARTATPLLPSQFVEQDFEFFSRMLLRAERIQPRWKRCVALVDVELGQALGRKYVEQEFSPQNRRRIVAMVAAIEAALRRDIGQLSWMTPAAKERAIEKLDAITNKIGYPAQWRDLSQVPSQRGEALANSFRAMAHETDYQLARIGQPADPNDWEVTPPTASAYYNVLWNEIYFPAGLLQPPFFDPARDDTINYGAIGAVIGHELIHGFDDDRSTPQEAAAFGPQAQCFVDQYAAYTAVDAVKLDGKLTLAENIADNGGLRLALMALAETGDASPGKGFFLGWGQLWCQNVRAAAARIRAANSLYSPGRHRVNGVVSNMPQFRKAFSCRTGQPMVREDACRVW